MEIKTAVQQYATTYYVSIDGLKFTRKYDCLQHEAAWYATNCYREIECHYDMSYDECPMTIYDIKNKEDYDYLVHTEWFYNASGRDYVGPGRYIDIIHDGGDDYDWHEIRFLDEYLDDMQTYINRIKDLTNS